jgi:predicted metalloprotease
VRYRGNARLDTSGVQDRRGVSGGTLAAGGGGLGVLGLVAVILFQVLGGGSGGSGGAAQLSQVLGGLGSGQSADNTQLQAECQTGEDANTKLDCAVVADIDSIQDYWSAQLPAMGARYSPTSTVFFRDSVQTACGGATSGTGPFYCPADQLVYIDLSFYEQLRTDFGAEGGLFVDAYVIAHEYAHHVQNLLGTSDRVRPGESGPTSGSVRLELQADCYAGAWAHHATTTPDESGQPLIVEITEDDIDRALDAAGRIGDDYIQQNLGGGRVDEEAFTHGSSDQRRHWFTTGYETGDPTRCDTFATNDLG